MDARYLAIEGPPGVGKAVLGEGLGQRLDASLVLDDGETAGELLGGDGQRLRERARRSSDRRTADDEDIGELNDAFNHFFFHYTGAPLLVVETSSLDLDWCDEDVEDLLRQVEHMQQGTQYYVPRQR